MNKPVIISYNEKYVEADQQLLNALTPGVKNLPGVFETMRVYDRKIFAFKDHFQRMARGLKVYGYQCQRDQDRIETTISTLLKKNQLTEARVRVSFALAKNKIDEAIVCLPLTKIPSRKYALGYKVKIAPMIKKKTQLSNVKALAYEGFLRTYHEARREGYDEAVFLNSQKRVIEGTRTNIFCFLKGELYTPPIANGCLNGITRQLILKIGRQLGIKMRVENISLNELFASEEAFLTNSIIELMPIQSVNGKIIGQGPRERSLKLHRALQKHIKDSINEAY